MKRFKNKGYRYYLGKEPKQPPQLNIRISKTDINKRYIKLMKKNCWTRAELARHLRLSRAWVSKILNN